MPTKCTYTSRIDQSRFESVEKCSVFIIFECSQHSVFKVCRLELFRCQNLPFSKSASKNVPFSCEREDYPSHSSPFSKCAAIMLTQSNLIFRQNYLYYKYLKFYGNERCNYEKIITRIKLQILSSEILGFHLFVTNMPISIIGLGSDVDLPVRKKKYFWYNIRRLRRYGIRSFLFAKR